MRTRLKKLFMIGAGIAHTGLTLANKKKVRKIVGEFVVDGKLALKESRLLVKDVFKEAKSLREKYASKVKNKKG